MAKKLWLLVFAGIAALLLAASFGRPGSISDAAAQGLPAHPAQASGASLNLSVSLSKPGNGKFYAKGEQPVVTVILKDKRGSALNKSDFATLNLYAYGPQETAKTVTASKLLNASTDRSKRPHHYIDLLTNAKAQLQGTVLKYTLQPISNEEAGTYTASVWAVKKGNPPANQAFLMADFQLGTATVEKQIVDKDRCAACHLGSSNGQFYMHHTDPTAANPYGNPALDSSPVRSCKSCHNNDGYAAYSGNIADATVPATARTPDPIVRRVHGVHMGEALKNPFNIDPKSGNFKDYIGVVFPPNAKNCTTCHVDDRWKTKPTRQACGACHDGIWFGEAAATPAKLKNHPGGPQANDRACSQCHTADAGGAAPISVAHKVSQPLNDVLVSLTPPANGKFYTAGDKPVVTMVVKDDAGNPIDHTLVTDASFSTAGLFVSGNRANTVPVLTNTARFGMSKLRAVVVNTIAASGTPTRGWTFAAGSTFKIAVNAGAPVELQAPVGLQTPAQVGEWLRSKLSGVTVTASATNVTIKSNLQGEQSRIDIYNSPVTTTMGWKPRGLKYSKGVTSGLTMEPSVTPARASYPTNDLRKLSDPLDYSDTAVTRNARDITYQLDDVAGLAPGTYSVYVWVQPIAGKAPKVSKPAIGFMNFQVGTEKEELKVASNCTQCHGNTIWHLDEGPQHPEPFNPDHCKSCHDYARNQTGDGFANLGGTSLNGWSGYGAVPLSRRTHGVHRARYLEHPEQIYAGNPDAFREVIFPQDIRNCTKCHDPSGSPAWKEKPSRLACMSCHDSDHANAHAKLMTEYPTPADPWSSNRVETCKICHGAGKELAADKVHNVATPYKPPYPREPELK